jgi:hypothetical protein
MPMEKNFTSEKLLQFVYNEIEEEAEKLLIQSKLEENAALNEEYTFFKLMKSRIERDKKRSMDFLVKNIMNYSKVQKMLKPGDSLLYSMNCN